MDTGTEYLYTIRKNNNPDYYSAITSFQADTFILHGFIT